MWNYFGNFGHVRTQAGQAAEVDQAALQALGQKQNEQLRNPASRSLLSALFAKWEGTGFAACEAQRLKRRNEWRPPTRT